MPLLTMGTNPDPDTMPNYLEVLLSTPKTGQTVNALDPQMIELTRLAGIGTDPTTGRASVRLYVAGPANANAPYPTFETYDALANRLATITPSNPSARASSADKTAATNARAADVSAATSTSS